MKFQTQALIIKMIFFALKHLFYYRFQFAERIGNPRYKTEICRNFKERSKCIYGDKCQFAHGRRELRDVIRNSKYKTKPCQKYWLIGYCAYGPRCNFLHDEASEQELMDWNSIHNGNVFNTNTYLHM